jgi:hypothetical protein
VVEARREDWERDPFTLIGGNGDFYARGVADTKAMAAVWVDALICFKQQGYAPTRTISVALTCGEETNPFNDIEWLAANRRELIDAGFRPQRRRRRRQRRQGEGDRPVGPDRREDLRQFPGGNAQPRRTQFHAGA